MKTTYIDPEHFGVADLVPLTSPPFLLGVTESAYLLTRINIPKKFRGRGYGSVLLDHVLREADREGATIAVEISPSDGLTYDELARWYGKRGFGLTEIGYWIRRPKN